MLIIVSLVAYLLLLAWCILFLRGSTRLKTPQPQDNASAEDNVLTAPHKKAESAEAQHIRRDPAYRHSKGLVRKVG